MNDLNIRFLLNVDTPYLSFSMMFKLFDSADLVLVHFLSITQEPRWVILNSYGSLRILGHIIQ